MQGNTLNFIPTGKWKSMDIMRNDLPKLTEDTGYIFKRIKSKIDTIRRQERRSILLQQSIKDMIDLLQDRYEDRAIEIAEKISTNTSLVSSKGQPSWQPPIQKYTPPPNGIAWTPTQIRAFKEQKERNEGFARQNITITTAPLSVEDFDAGEISIAKLHPGILSTKVRHERHIHTRETVRTPHFTTEEIITQMGYAVDLMPNPRNNDMELLGIYAYKYSAY